MVFFTLGMSLPVIKPKIDSMERRFQSHQNNENGAQKGLYDWSSNWVMRPIYRKLGRPLTWLELEETLNCIDH